MDKALEFLSTKQYVNAIREYESILSTVEITDYMLPGAVCEFSKESLITLLVNLGTIYKMYFEEYIGANMAPNKYSDQLFIKSVGFFNSILSIQPEHEVAEKQMTSIYTEMCYLTQNNYTLTIEYLLEVLQKSPFNAVIHYNLGHMYQKVNDSKKSLFHYKLGANFAKENDIKINCYNGIGCMYRANKLWVESLHYLLLGLRVNSIDPDINNQLGIVYTELRDTDTALKCYNIALDNYSRSIVTQDKSTLLSDIYLNMGHMYSYNGNNEKSIDVYNESLKINPKFLLPFQNKLMNLLYIYNDIEDKGYIARQHKLINKLLNAKPCKMEPRNRTNNDVLNIGIVSGDFIEHPVSFFINTFLEHHTTNFKVVCYSQSTGSSPKLQENDQYKIIKNVSADDAVKLIKSDDIDILIDLSGHTAANRLDIFAKRAAPVQISYCGYPYTTGLVNMDYRITDKVCDNPNVFDKNYTEKLLFMDNCFLCWGGKIDVELEDNSTDQFIRIGCFNRLNKINDDMIALFNKVLENVHNTLLVFKTKALLNEDVKEKFLEKFNKYKDRVSVLKCTVLHDAHLKVYNQIDVAIDTFPYSGTTTSCEALSVGVPVYTIYNNDTFYHPQNVTTSLLVNSGLDEFVCKDADDIVSRLQTLSLKGLRERIYNSFTYGKVCDKKVYTANFEELLKLNL